MGNNNFVPKTNKNQPEIKTTTKLSITDVATSIMLIGSGLAIAAGIFVMLFGDKPTATNTTPTSTPASTAQMTTTPLETTSNIDLLVTDGSGAINEVSGQVEIEATLSNIGSGAAENVDYLVMAGSAEKLAGVNKYNLPLDDYTSFEQPFILSDSDATQKSGHGSCPDINFQGANSSNALLSQAEFEYRHPMATRISDMSGTSEGDEACQMSPNIAMNNGSWTGFSLATDCPDGQGCVISNITVPAEAEDRFYKWELNNINFVMQRWSHSNWESNRTNTDDGPLIFTLNGDSECTSGGNCWSGSWNSNGNIIEISVNFNSNDILESYSVYGYDGDNGGGAWVQGIFHLKTENYNNSVTHASSDYITFEQPFILSDSDATQKSGHGSCPDINFQAPGTSNYKISEEYFGYRVPMATRIYNNDGTSEGDEICQMSDNISFNSSTWTGIAIAADCPSGSSCEIVSGSPFTAETADQYYKWEIDKINFVMQRWSHNNWEDNRTDTDDGLSIFTLSQASTCTAGGNCWSGSWNSNGNIIEISVNFDANDKLESYSVYGLDGSDGGGTWVQGIFHLKHRMINFNDEPLNGYLTFEQPFILNNSDATQKSGHGSCPDINFQGANSSNTLISEAEFGNRRPMATRISYMSGTSEGDEACQMSGNIGMNNGSWTGFSLAADCPDNQSCVIASGTFAADLQDRYHKSDIEKIGFIMQRWSHSNWEGNWTDTDEGPSIFTLDETSTCFAGGNCWSGGWNYYGNVITISVNFNQNDILESYSVYAIDGDDGGGAWVQGIFHLNDSTVDINTLDSLAGGIDYALEENYPLNGFEDMATIAIDPFGKIVETADDNNHEEIFFTNPDRCTDGTIYGECNNYQRYCDNGTLISGCGYCGVNCPSGYFCRNRECCKKVGGSLQCGSIYLPLYQAL